MIVCGIMNFTQCHRLKNYMLPTESVGKSILYYVYSLAQDYFLLASPRHLMLPTRADFLVYMYLTVIRNIS